MESAAICVCSDLEATAAPAHRAPASYRGAKPNVMLVRTGSANHENILIFDISFVDIRLKFCRLIADVSFLVLFCFFVFFISPLASEPPATMPPPCQCQNGGTCYFDDNKALCKYDIKGVTGGRGG